MNRDERQQCQAVAEELSGWVDLAAPIRASRADLARRAVAAKEALSKYVVEVRRHNEVAWRVLLLRPQDRELLRDMAAYRSLPPISTKTHEALVSLTGEVATAIADVRAVMGVRRLFSSSGKREKGDAAAQLLLDFRTSFFSSDLPAILNQLSAARLSAVSAITVAEALSPQVGLATAMGNLGGSAELLPVQQTFLGFRQACVKVGGAAKEEARCRSAAVDAGNELRRAEAARIVAEMPVERLRDATRDRINTAPLKAAGITTVLDVINAGSLEHLPGIGPTLATRMQGAAQTLWQTTFDEMPARIDIKRRTTHATDLLRRLREWDEVRRIVGSTEDLRLAEELGPLAKAMDSSVTHAVVFCAHNATASGLVQSVERLLGRAARLSDIRAGGASGDPWDDFIARPADYFALLSELGFLTEDEEKAHGDLAEDIVQAVRALELKTEFLSASLRGYQSFGARFALVQRKVIIGWGSGRRWKRLRSWLICERSGRTASW